MKQQIIIESTQDSIINGYVLLTDYKPVEVHVTLTTFVEIKGKIGTEKIGIVSHSLDPHTISTSSEKIPFSIIVDDHKMATYIGKYVSFNHTIEAEILFDEMKTKRTKEYYEVKNDSNYVVKEETYPIEKIGKPFYVMFFSSNIFKFIVFTMIFIYFSDYLRSYFPEGNFIRSILDFIHSKYSAVEALFNQGESWIVIAVIGVIAILSVVNEMILERKSSAINLNLAISKAPEGFTANLTYNREKFQVTQLWYEIMEHVIDDRGTTKNEYKHQIYSSNKVELSDYHTFSFPDIKGLRPVGTENTAIVWVLKGVGRSKDFISMKKEFEMSLKVGIENISCTKDIIYKTNNI